MKTLSEGGIKWVQRGPVSGQHFRKMIVKPMGKMVNLVLAALSWRVSCREKGEA